MAELQAHTVGRECMKMGVENVRRTLRNGGGTPEWLSDHPANGRRIDDLHAKLPSAMALYKSSGRHPNCHH